VSDPRNGWLAGDFVGGDQGFVLGEGKLSLGADPGNVYASYAGGFVASRD
jgi:hypothetical protein